MSRVYRKYDSSIQDAVILSGNINLFPKLKIPRSTALSWIRSSKKKSKLKDYNLDNALLDRIKKLESELEKERAKTTFLKDLIGKFSGRTTYYSSKKNKEVIVKSFEKFKSLISINEMCRLTSLLSTTYYKYRIDILGCPKISFKKCKVLSPNQLTFKEQENIYNLLNDERLSHLSIRGFQYHAFREGIVQCGYDTWRKYAKVFRSEKRKKKKKYKKGIRASRVNEIWHIDITEFKLKDGKKIYLQVIMDNLSRKIINWKFSSNKKQSVSIENIVKATKKQIPEILMSDGGGENVSHGVKRLLAGKGIVSLIAKKDTLFSNSMIEGFFNILKNRFLDKFKRYKFSKLYRNILRAIEYFNNSPLPVLDGARPHEVYSNLVSREELAKQLRDESRNARKLRPSLNRLCFRQKCG